MSDNIGGSGACTAVYAASVNTYIHFTILFSHAMAKSAKHMRTLILKFIYIYTRTRTHTHKTHSHAFDMQKKRHKYKLSALAYVTMRPYSQ